jgi:hypothetical protein
MRLYKKLALYSIFFTSIALATTTKNNVLGLVPGGGEHSISFVGSANNTNYKVIFSNPDQQHWFNSRIVCDSNHLCNVYFSAKANAPDISLATGYIESENATKTNNTPLAFSLSSMHPQVNLKITRDKESPNTFQINLTNAIVAPLIFGDIILNNAEISSNTCPNNKLYPIGQGNSSCSFKAKVNDNICKHTLNIPVLTGNNRVLSTITKNINLCNISAS